MIITVGHIRGSKLCMSGAREWFESHNLSWSDFLENGLPKETIAALNDPLADRVIAFAESVDG